MPTNPNDLEYWGEGEPFRGIPGKSDTLGIEYWGEGEDLSLLEPAGPSSGGSDSPLVPWRAYQSVFSWGLIRPPDNVQAPSWGFTLPQPDRTAQPTYWMTGGTAPRTPILPPEGIFSSAWGFTLPQPDRTKPADAWQQAGAKVVLRAPPEDTVPRQFQLPQPDRTPRKLWENTTGSITLPKPPDVTVDQWMRPLETPDRSPKPIPWHFAGARWTPTQVPTDASWSYFTLPQPSRAPMALAYLHASGKWVFLPPEVTVDQWAFRAVLPIIAKRGAAISDIAQAVPIVPAPTVPVGVFFQLPQPDRTDRHNADQILTWNPTMTGAGPTIPNFVSNWHFQFPQPERRVDPGYIARVIVITGAGPTPLTSKAGLVLLGIWETGVEFGTLTEKSPEEFGLEE